MKKLLCCFIFVSSAMVLAQTKVKDTITRRANISYTQKGNSVTFKPETPPLIPIAGAPKPSYSYLWELGDGHYSKQAEPKHVYKNKGSYTTRLAVTNNYDNGKPPATRPKKVVVNEIADDPYQDIASIADQNGFTIQKKLRSHSGTGNGSRSQLSKSGKLCCKRKAISFLQRETIQKQ